MYPVVTSGVVIYSTLGVSVSYTIINKVSLISLTLAEIEIIVNGSNVLGGIII